MIEMPQWLTVVELASQTKTSKMTIYRILQSGKLPYTRIGRSIRIDAEDWNRYLNDHKVSAF